MTHALPSTADNLVAPFAFGFIKRGIGLFDQVLWTDARRQLRNATRKGAGKGRVLHGVAEV